MATTRSRISLADHGRKMTLEEFREADEEPGYLYELARGVLRVIDFPGDYHSQVIHNVHEAFSDCRRVQPYSILWVGHGSDIRLIIPELESDRHPDLAVVFRDAARTARGRQIPALIVEVVSPGKRAQKRDFEDKREEYLNLGIREYWTVDPLTRRVVILNRRGEATCPAWESREFHEDDVIVSELLPGFEGRVSEFWLDLEDQERGGDGG